MNFLSTAWTLACTDLRKYFRDRLALMLGFLLPIALVTVFGFIMGQAAGGGGAMPKVTLWVSDRDQTETSERLIQSLRESEMIRVQPSDQSMNAATPSEREAIEQKVADGEASHVLVIEAGFAEEIEAGNDGEVRLIRDPGRAMEQRMIEIGLMQSLFSVRGNDYWATMMKQQFAEAGMPTEQLDQFSISANEMTEAIGSWIEASDVNPFDSGNASPMGMMRGSSSIKTTDVTPPSRPKNATYQMAQSVAGVSVMMLMFGMASAGTSLVTQRSDGTLDRLLSAPVPRGSILIGKVMFLGIVGLLQMAVLLSYGEALFRIGMFRDPVTLLLLTVAWTVSATSFGLLIAAFSKTARQAESITPVITLTLSALGGCWFPLQMLSLPAPVEMLCKSTVTYWAMSGFQGYLWDGLSFTSSKILFAIAVQAAFTVITLSVAAMLFRRNYLRG